MHKDLLAARNTAMAQAMHQVPFRHRVRRAALYDVARLRIPPLPAPPGDRLLLIRPDHLGDVLLSSPAFRALRSALPSAEIHALVGGWSAEVAAQFDALNYVLTVPFPGFSRTPKLNWRSPYVLAWRTARQLRRIGYSAAFILRPDHWWGAMVAHLAGIPRIIGYDVSEVRPFLTDALQHEREHAVRQNLRLIEAYLGQPISRPVYRFEPTETDRAWVDGFLEEWGVSRGSDIIAIHPGSGTWVKRWDEKHWAFAADALADQVNATVVFTGADRELEMVRAIAGSMRHRPCIMVGDTRIGALAALFARSRIVLGPDSGPLHLAVAVGTPTVTLFGPADPVEFGPWIGAQTPPDKHAVLTTAIACRPCRILDWSGDDPAMHPCVRDIQPRSVLDAAHRALKADDR